MAKIEDLRLGKVDCNNQDLFFSKLLKGLMRKLQEDMTIRGESIDPHCQTEVEYTCRYISIITVTIKAILWVYTLTTSECEEVLNTSLYSNTTKTPLCNHCLCVNDK